MYSHNARLFIQQFMQAVFKERHRFSRSWPGAFLTITGLALLMLASVVTRADGDVGFSENLTLPDGRVVVVSEPTAEPRSVGSYSIRVYSGANPQFPFDDFVCGVVLARDGFLEKVALEDLDSDGSAELVVVMRSAGSGSYLSARAFSLDGGVISQVAGVDGLEPRADPIQQMRY